MHESFDVFKFRLDTTTDSGVICHLASVKLMYEVVNTSFISDRIFFIFAGNKDSHKVSDGFEIRPDRTMDCGVSCPYRLKKP